MIKILIRMKIKINIKIKNIMNIKMNGKLKIYNILYKSERVRLYTRDPLGLITIVNAPVMLISITRFDFVKLLILNNTSFGNRRTVASAHVALIH